MNSALKRAATGVSDIQTRIRELPPPPAPVGAPTPPVVPTPPVPAKRFEVTVPTVPGNAGVSLEPEEDKPSRIRFNVNKPRPVSVSVSTKRIGNTGPVRNVVNATRKIGKKFEVTVPTVPNNAGVSLEPEEEKPTRIRFNNRLRPTNTKPRPSGPAVRFNTNTPTSVVPAPVAADLPTPPVNTPPVVEPTPPVVEPTPRLPANAPIVAPSNITVELEEGPRNIGNNTGVVEPTPGLKPALKKGKTAKKEKSRFQRLLAALSGTRNGVRFNNKKTNSTGKSVAKNYLSRRNVDELIDLMRSRLSGPSSRPTQRIEYLNETNSQIFANVSSKYNEPENIRRAINKLNVSEKSKRKMKSRLNALFENTEARPINEREQLLTAAARLEVPQQKGMPARPVPEFVRAKLIKRIFERFPT